MLRDKRLWIAVACALVAASALHQRGLRYPPLQFEPLPPPSAGILAAGLEVDADGAMLVPNRKIPTLRAFVPEPTLHLYAGADGWQGELRLENIHPEAEVQAEGFSIQRQGLSVLLEGTADSAATWDIHVLLPTRTHWRFAAIGDGGGREEIAWCFQRAAELGAHFILHVGDIAYTDADATAASKTWNASPIPIYTAIGNHDFHGGHRNRWQFFQDEIGPRNSHFSIAGVDFANLDTAADLLPAGGGERGKLLASLAAARETAAAAGIDLAPLVAFTHRPLADPRVLRGQRNAEQAHALNRKIEQQWLHNALRNLQATALIAGHIHQSTDFDDRGLRTLLAGDGLGQRKHKSRILIGDFTPGQAPIFRFEPLDFPADALRQDRRTRL